MNIIDAKKKLSSMQKESRKETKPSKCILCGKETSRFCNSHSVPQFVLKNITIDGKVLNAGYAIDIPIISSIDGVNRSGTFMYICRECDSTYFSDYENESALKNEPTNIMLAEIALKDSIQQLSKRNYEVGLYKTLQDEYQMYENKEALDDIQKLDIRDYDFEMRRAKKIIDKKLKSGYNTIFSELLPYTVPIAAQTGITLDKDLDGGIINDVYYMSDDTIVQTLHCGIFPLKGMTRIILCRHKDDRKYLKFEKQFSRLSASDKLKYVNYYIFKYAENYFFSPTIKSIVEGHEKLKALSRETNGIPNYGIVTDFISDCLAYKPVGIHEIPNFLEERYHLNVEE